jgi:hypothetical protein
VGIGEPPSGDGSYIKIENALVHPKQSIWRLFQTDIVRSIAACSFSSSAFWLRNQSVDQMRCISQPRERMISSRSRSRSRAHFAEDGLLYWTMGAPLDQTTIINRCEQQDSYENRLKNGTLPPAKSSE